jgi:hypothetical protein
MRFSRSFINVGGGAKFHYGFLKFAFLQIFFAAGNVFLFGLTAAAGESQTDAQEGKQR